MYIFCPRFCRCISSNAHRNYTVTVQIIVSPEIRILLMYPLEYRNLTMDIMGNAMENQSSSVSFMQLEEHIMQL
jgi:hypothetical protein